MSCVQTAGAVQPSAHLGLNKTAAAAAAAAVTVDLMPYAIKGKPDRVVPFRCHLPRHACIAVMHVLRQKDLQ
jgi:hypothetical protein